MTGKRTDKAANDDAARSEADFLRLMKALLAYVMVRSDAPRGLARDLQARLAAASGALDRLWEAPQLIDEFLAENPTRLDERDLATIASWRSPVMGRFVVTGIQGKRFSCLPADADMPPRLIVVQLIRREADELFRTIPCLIELVLLPFRGAIVTDGRIKRLSSATKPGGALVIECRLRLAALHKLIQTPSDLAELAQSKLEKTAGHGSTASPRGSPTPQHARAMLNASFTSSHDNKEGASP